jgi:3-isopropylmalate dehydratase small subunit
VAGFITTPDQLPEKPATFEKTGAVKSSAQPKTKTDKPTRVEGRVWIIDKDDIDTDMIFHNRYLTITDIKEMGQYTFDNLKGHEDFAKKAQRGDIVITRKNFGAGSSRQQAVDCFLSLGISCILAESYGAIYERNAINAAMPILTYDPAMLEEAGIKDGDRISVDFETGEVINLNNQQKTRVNKFYDAQALIYRNGGLL